MEGTARIWFTSQQRAELWECWKNGQCVADIARALERRNKSGVYHILALNGGIAPEPRALLNRCFSPYAPSSRPAQKGIVGYSNRDNSSGSLAMFAC
jgi:hypothetical protein